MTRLRLVINAIPTGPGGGLAVLTGLLGGWRELAAPLDVTLLVARPESRAALAAAGYGDLVRDVAVRGLVQTQLWLKRELPGVVADCGAHVLQTNNFLIPGIGVPQVVHHQSLFTLFARGWWRYFSEGARLSSPDMIALGDGGWRRPGNLRRAFLSRSFVKACREGVRFIALTRGARAALRRADANVFISGYLRECAERLVPESAARNHVIHNGVGADYIRAAAGIQGGAGIRPDFSSADVAPAVEENATGGTPVPPAPGGRPERPSAELCAVQSHDPHKDTATLLRAFARIVRDEPARDWKLTIAGGGDWTRWRRMADELGVGPRVLFHGHASPADLLALYRRCGALLFPSLFEAFGMPVIEAMACGCPVIAVDGTAVPEVAGDAALLVPPRDPAAIAAAAVRLYNDPALRAELVQRGRQRALRFAWRDSAAAFLGLYQTLARPQAVEPKTVR